MKKKKKLRHIGETTLNHLEMIGVEKLSNLKDKDAMEITSKVYDV